jgi:hypothetical protein
MPDPKELRTFVKDGDVAVIVCPTCGIAKEIKVGQYRNVMHTLKVNCRCGVTFKVLLDFRQNYRKPTNLAGTYVMIPPAAGGGKMMVKNVSLSGIGFEITGHHAIQTGQKAIVEFTLDNRKESHIKKQITVRSIRGSFIGGEFQQDQAFEKDLGFYLRF